MMRLLGKIGLLVLALFPLSPAFGADVLSEGFPRVLQQIFLAEGGHISPSNRDQCNATLARHVGESHLLAFVEEWICRNLTVFQVRMDYTGATQKQLGTANYYFQVAQGCRIGSTSYGYRMNVWTCPSSGDCSKARSFSRAMSACYDVAADSTRENIPYRGVIVADSNLMSTGGNGGKAAVYYAFERGTPWSPAQIAGKMIYEGGTVYAESSRTGTTQYRLKAAYFSTQLKRSFRLVADVNTQSNSGKAYLEGRAPLRLASEPVPAGPGLGQWRPNVSGGNAASGACWSRTGSPEAYSYRLLSSGAACRPAAPFPAMSWETLMAETYAGITGGFWGMAANPPLP